MEAFEQFVAVALQTDGYVVSGSQKFPVRRRVKKAGREEYQTHGYEVDLVGARANGLVLASVKSFFGSRGVQARDVIGEGKDRGLYRLINDPDIRDGVVSGAAERYGYDTTDVSIRFYVGKFAGRDEEAVRTWALGQQVGAGSIEVIGLTEIVEAVRSAAGSRTYFNDAVVVAMKVLAAAGLLDLERRPAKPTGHDLDEIQG